MARRVRRLVGLFFGLMVGGACRRRVRAFYLSDTPPDSTERRAERARRCATRDKRE